MEPLRDRAPLVGAIALGVTAVCFLAAVQTERPGYGVASIACSVLALGAGLVARSRRATLALVIPALVFLTLVVDLKGL